MVHRIVYINIMWLMYVYYMLISIYYAHPITVQHSATSYDCLKEHIQIIIQDK